MDMVSPHTTYMYMYRSLAEKGPWALYLTSSPDKGVGGYLRHRCINYEKAPTYVYITLTFNGYCTSTYRLVQYKLIQFSSFA